MLIPDDLSSPVGEKWGTSKRTGARNLAGVNWGSVVTIRQKGMYIIIKGRMGVSTEQVRKCTLAGAQV